MLEIRFNERRKQMQANYRIGGLAIALIISQFSSAALAHDEPDVAQFADFDYNGEVKVTIRNETTLPITLSGVPVNEDTCEVNFQFDDYDDLTTGAFFMHLPAGHAVNPNLMFRNCFDPGSFKADLGVQVSTWTKGKGQLAVSCNFDIGACEAMTVCDAATDGFVCAWAGGLSSYQFLLTPAAPMGLPEN